MLQQEKRHAQEKEMQQQKLQEEKNQRQDVNVVHLQEKLQGEELPEEEDARTSYSFFIVICLIPLLNSRLTSK